MDAEPTQKPQPPRHQPYAGAQMEQPAMPSPDDANEAPPTIDGVGRGMPAWVPRAIILFWLGYVVLRIAEGVLSALRGLIITLLISLFLSFAMEPAVNRLARRGWRRGSATALVFVIVLGFAGIFSFAIGSLVVTQVREFIDQAPDYVKNVEHWVNSTFNAHVDF